MAAQRVFYVKVKDSLQQVCSAGKWKRNHENEYGEGAKRGVKRLEREEG